MASDDVVPETTELWDLDVGAGVLDVDVDLVECPMAGHARSSGAFEVGFAALADAFCAPGAPPCQATPD